MNGFRNPSERWGGPGRDVEARLEGELARQKGRLRDVEAVEPTLNSKGNRHAYGMDGMNVDYPVEVCDTPEGSQAHSAVDVSVCGQELRLNNIVPSIEVLQNAVQRAVGMEVDCFMFFDTAGNQLVTDYDVREAFTDGRTPLQVSLCSSAVYAWNQRQQGELRHVESQVQDLREQLEKHVDKVHVEMEECRRSCDATEGLVEGLAKQIGKYATSPRHDGMLPASPQGAPLGTAALEAALSIEASKRISADEQLQQDVHALFEKVDVLAQDRDQHQDELKTCSFRLDKVTAEVFRQEVNETLREAKETANVTSELRHKLELMEERVASTETLVTDISGRWMLSYDRLQGQCDKALQAVESCRLACRTVTATSKETQEKAELFSGIVQSVCDSVRADISTERRQRLEQIRNSQDMVNSKLKSLQSNLEIRMSQYMDLEAEKRSASIVQALDDIGGTIEKPIASSLRSSSQGETHAVGNVEVITARGRELEPKNALDGANALSRSRSMPAGLFLQPPGTPSTSSLPFTAPNVVPSSRVMAYQPSVGNRAQPFSSAGSGTFQAGAQPQPRLSSAGTRTPPPPDVGQAQPLFFARW